MSTPVGRHERVYRRLLRLYPGAFRARYGDEMVQLFGDQLHAGRLLDESIGATRLWIRTLWDLVVTASSEHRRDRSVARSLSAPPTATSRLMGALGIAGGALLLAAWIPAIPWGVYGFNLRLILFNVGAIAIVAAVHRRQAPIARRLSYVGAIPAIAANAWYLVMILLATGRPVFPEPDPDFRLVFFWAGVALWLSDALFGIVALRIGVVTRWGALALTVGALLAGPGMDRLGFTTGPFSSLMVPLALSGIFLVGVGWIWLGIDVATRRRPTKVPLRPRP
jgi:hypothetical protein